MDVDARLPIHLWIDAHLRQCQIKGIGFYIVNKGAMAGGTVILKLNNLSGACKLYSQIRDVDGNLAWMHALKSGISDKEEVEEREADAYIARSIERDPDVWVIEIEDKNFFNPFEGKVIG